MNRKIGVILSYILMVFEVLSTLLLTPFIIRTLGQSEYGVYKLAAAINAYLLLLDLGVGNAITRYISKYRVENNRDKAGQFLGVATVFYLIVAVLTVIIGMILIKIFPDVFATGLSTQEVVLGQRLLSITMINSAITLGTAAYTNVLIAYEKFTVSKGASIIQIIIRMGLTYFALKIGMGSIGIVTVNLFLTVCCRGFFVFYVFWKIRLFPKFSGIEISFVKEIVSYSSLILLQMIATQLNATVDQVLIGSLVSSSAVILAIYGVGTQIVQYFQSIGSAFNSVLMPGIVKLVEHKSSARVLTDEMIRIGRIIFMSLALIWCGFLVNGRRFICLWAGANNIQAYIVTFFLMTAYLFILTEAIGTQILWAMNQHKEQAILKIVIVLLNILFTIFLIRWNPLIGATIGTFISLIVGDVVVNNVIYVKKIGINLLHYYKGLFKGIIPVCIVTVLIGLLANRYIIGGWVAFIINVLIMVIVYITFMLGIGMNSYEKNLFLSLLRRFI